MNLTAPCVLRKHGGRHALLIKAGRTKYEVIELTNVQLLIKKYSDKELELKGYQAVPSLSPYQVAEKFLKHSAGLSPNAKAALESLQDLSFLD